MLLIPNVASTVDITHGIIYGNGERNVLVLGLGIDCSEMVTIVALGSAPWRQCKHYEIRKSITAHLLNQC